MMNSRRYRVITSNPSIEPPGTGMGKSVKVHDDTHRALKSLKARRRSGSIDQVIRELIRASTGKPVEGVRPTESDDITRYVAC